MLAAAAAAAGCASSRDSIPSGPGVRGVFRAGQGAYTGSQAAWYSPRKPPQFDKTGPVAWSADPFAKRRGFSAWVARVFARKPKPGAAPEAPLALAPVRSGLPVPSYVYVTNLTTFATVKVRVEQRASMGTAVIGLSPQAAGPLGVEPGQPLMVRVSYAAPMVAYREPPPLRYARRRPAKAEPQLAAVPPPAPAAVNVSAVGAAPRPVAVAAVVPPPLPVLRPALDAPPPSALRIQAGAFADPRNAARAVVMLARAGRATVEPLQREGRTTLYRVVLRAPADARAAEALRAKVVEIGFSDARLVRPS